MRILVITQYYYPEQFRVNDICETLAKRGHTVTVVTGLPNYPEGEIYEEYKDSYSEEEFINGVRILRCNLRPRHIGSINLIRNYISFVHQSKKLLKRINEVYDVVYVYEISPVTVGIPAIYYKKHHRIPIYLYCLDIWPECVRDRGEKEPLNKRHPVYVVALMLSKYVYKHVDEIGIKCIQFSDYLQKVCKVPKNKMKLLYEHAEQSYLEVAEEAQQNGCYDFMFLGNIGSSQKCETIIKALEGIDETVPFKLHFVGSGSELENLKRFVNNHKLESKVIFHGRHPLSEINDYYDFADCCVMNLTCKTAVGYTLTAKLTSYMAASRPIIAAAEGATKDIIESADCGICVDSDNEEQLRAAMVEVLKNQSVFRDKGKKGRKYFLEHFTIDQHVGELENQLLHLVENHLVENR